MDKELLTFALYSAIPNSMAVHHGRYRKSNNSRHHYANDHPLLLKRVMMDIWNREDRED